MPDEVISAAAARLLLGQAPPGADRRPQASAGAPRKPPVQRELALQIASADYLAALDWWPEGSAPLALHIPNERRSRLEAVRMQRCGVKAGAPDWILALPLGRTLWIELKVDAYPSPEQKRFAATLAALGHEWRLCRSIEEMAAAMREQGLTWAETPRALAIRRAYS